MQFNVKLLEPISNKVTWITMMKRKKLRLRRTMINRINTYTYQLLLLLLLWRRRGHCTWRRRHRRRIVTSWRHGRTRIRPVEDLRRRIKLPRSHGRRGQLDGRVSWEIRSRMIGRRYYVANISTCLNDS